MQRAITGLATLIVVMLSGCTVATAPRPDVLTGRYAGSMPCADCDGIRLVLELYEKTADGPPTRYTLERAYLGTPDGDRRYIEVGEWAILRGSGADSDATVYQLDPGKPGKTQSFLLRGDRELVLLDPELGEIQSALPGTLTRVP